jgi:hypothetical protein
MSMFDELMKYSQDPGLNLDAGRASRRRRRGGGIKPSLTVLSNGLGRDSATMGALLVAGKLVVDGERLRPQDVDLVIFSDTGYEWSFSYQVIPVMEKMLAKAGVPFVVLHKPPKAKWKRYVETNRKAFIDAWAKVGAHKNVFDEIFVRGGRVDRLRAKTKIAPPWVVEDFADMADKAARGGYHTRAPMLQQYSMYSRIPTRGRAECTDAHKIQPIERFIGDMVQARFGLPLLRNNRLKHAPNSFQAEVERGERAPIRVLIGFAANETRRVAKGKAAVARMGKTWKRELYPLVDMGITKDDETPILKRAGLNWIRKSGCMLCHWQPVGWFWALSVQDPKLFRRIEAYEREALRRDPRMHIRGRKPIGQSVREWRAKNPSATLEDVLDKSYDRYCSASSGGANVLPVLIPAWGSANEDELVFTDREIREHLFELALREGPVYASAMRGLWPDAQTLEQQAVERVWDQDHDGTWAEMTEFLGPEVGEQRFLSAIRRYDEAGPQAVSQMLLDSE